MYNGTKMVKTVVKKYSISACNFSSMSNKLYTKSMGLKCIILVHCLYFYFSLFCFSTVQLLDTLDLKSSSGIDRVQKVFSKLNWNSFPGVQSLLLKVTHSFLSYF